MSPFSSFGERSYVKLKPVFHHPLEHFEVTTLRGSLNVYAVVLLVIDDVREILHLESRHVPLQHFQATTYHKLVAH